MAHTISVSETAQADLDRIFRWLGQRSVSGAVSWMMAFQSAVKSIAAAPESYEFAIESSSIDRVIRQSLFKTRRGRIYRIVFIVEGAHVTILRVRGPGQAPLRNRELPPTN